MAPRTLDLPGPTTTSMDGVRTSIASGSLGVEPTLMEVPHGHP
jgi:hypothetical protein